MSGEEPEKSGGFTSLAVESSGAVDEPLQPKPLADAHKRLKSWFKIILIIAVALFLACVALGVELFEESKRNKDDDDSGGSNNPTSAIPKDVQDDILSYRDTTASPCNDFYQYACGGWMSRQNLPTNPGAFASVSATFSTIANDTFHAQLSLLGDRYPFASNFYDGCMDTAKIDARGWQAPLGDWLALIGDSIPDVSTMFQTFAVLSQHGLAPDALIDLEVDALGQFASQYLIILSPSGLTLPSPSMYLNPNNTKALSTKIQTAFDAIGMADSAAAAASVVALEAKIALFTPEYATYEETIMDMVATTVRQLDTQSNLPLNATLATLGVYSRLPKGADSLIVAINSTWFGHLNSALTAETGEARSSYLKWHLINGAAPYLPEAFRNLTLGVVPGNAIRFRGRRHETVGTVDLKRRSFCIQQTTTYFGNLLSHMWISTSWPSENRALAERLVDLVYSKMGENLQTVGWLDSATRTAALEKWRLIAKNVAYDPDWDEYEGLVSVDTIFEDLIATNRNRVAATLATVFTPVQRNKFPVSNYMIVNAFYYPELNSINLLAGLMLKPMMDSRVPMELNLAGYGMVIGHEITHGFDNSGRLYNGTGAFRNWWSENATLNFESRAQCIVDQYNNFTVNGAHVNGKKTLGENIADMGGIHVAYESYNSNPPSTQLMEEYTNNQLFFLWFAQTWCTKNTPAYAQYLLAVDVHSPAKYRVLGPLSNFPPFAQAYGCSASDFMGRSLTSERCAIW